MSYILEALKKADQERAAGSIPDLESVHEQESTGRRRLYWVWIMGGLLVFNAVLITLLATRDTGVAPVATSNKPHGSTAAKGDDTALPPLLVPRPARPDKGPGRGPVAGRVKPAPATGVPDSAARSPKPVTAAKPQPEPKPVVAPTVQSAPKPVQPPTPRVVVAPVAPPSAVPEWEELPLEFRSNFQMPRLDVHVYDSNPRRRFVLVNLQKYHEGDRLEGGALLEKILRDGIQLSYQGTRFHYRK